VSESQPTSPQEARTDALEGEEVDALPVLAGAPRIVAARTAGGALADERRPASMPTVQAAVVAAGGFVAGAAVVGLVHRRGRRSAPLVKARRGGRGVGRRSEGKAARAVELVQIVGSRSLLVDVHLLGGSGDR
jgi:hypothetical protein